MDMFRTNFFITKHDDDDDTTSLLLKQTTYGYPFYESHQSLCILSGERLENRARLDWPPPFLENDSEVRILGSSSVNGIFCLFHGYEFMATTTTVLWNPATKQFKLVPPSHPPNHHPAECNTPSMGFGYDPVGEDYKVLRVAEYPLCFEGNWVWLPDANDHLWEMNELLDKILDNADEFWDGLLLNMYDPFWEIYSLKSNSWKKVEVFDVPYPLGGCGSSQVNLNEFCHWLGPQRSDVVSFDFRKEKFFSTKLPLDSDIMKMEWRPERRYLLVLNGSVSFICHYNMNMADCFYIWILGELGVKESWTKFSIVGPLTCSVMRPIGAGKKSHIFFRKKDNELAWYDFKTQRISEIWAKEELVSLQIVTYKQNLLILLEE